MLLEHENHKELILKSGFMIKKIMLYVLFFSMSFLIHASQEALPALNYVAQHQEKLSVPFTKPLRDYINESLRNSEKITSQRSKESVQVEDEVFNLFQERQLHRHVDRNMYALAWKFLAEKYKHNYKYIGSEIGKESQKTLRVRSCLSAYLYDKKAKQSIDALAQNGFGSWVDTEGLQERQFFVNQQYVPVYATLVCIYDCLKFMREEIGINEESFVHLIDYICQDTHHAVFENMDEYFDIMSVDKTRQAVSTSLQMIKDCELDKDVVRIMRESKLRIAFEEVEAALKSEAETKRIAESEQLALALITQEKATHDYKQGLVKKVFRHIRKFNEQNESAMKQGYDALKNLLSFQYRNSKHAAYVETVRKNREGLSATLEEESVAVEDSAVCLVHGMQEKSLEEIARKAQVEQQRKQRRANVVAQRQEEAAKRAKQSPFWGPVIFKQKERYTPGYVAAYDKTISVDSAVQTDGYECMCRQCCWHESAHQCGDDMIEALSIHNLETADQQQGCNQKSCWMKAALEKNCLCNACCMLRKITQDADRGDKIAQQIVQQCLHDTTKESIALMQSLYAFASCA